MGSRWPVRVPPREAARQRWQELRRCQDSRRSSALFPAGRASRNLRPTLRRGRNGHLATTIPATDQVCNVPGRSCQVGIQCQDSVELGLGAPRPWPRRRPLGGRISALSLPGRSCGRPRYSGGQVVGLVPEEHPSLQPVEATERADVVRASVQQAVVRREGRGLMRSATEVSFGRGSGLPSQRMFTSLGSSVQQRGKGQALRWSGPSRMTERRMLTEPCARAAATAPSPGAENASTIRLRPSIRAPSRTELPLPPQDSLRGVPFQRRPFPPRPLRRCILWPAMIALAAARPPPCEASRLKGLATGC